MGTTAVPGTTGHASSTQVAPVFTAAAAAASSPWTDVDLSAAVRTDTQGDGSARSPGIYTSTGSTLAVESTIVLNGSVHGRMGNGAIDGLFFTIELSDFDRTKHYAVAVRATWSNTLTGTWELYLGCGNAAVPVADAGVYLSSQLDSSAYAGGHDFGTLPNNNQSVTDARYLGGVINYRSDRQDGTVGQVATADRTSRGGQARSIDPSTAMSSDAQFLLVGFGNQNTTDTQTLTGLKVQYQLLAHHGQDS